MLYYNYAGIAQLVEQWIENPRVSSSNLDLGNLIRLLIRFKVDKILTQIKFKESDNYP